jgi:hypothetical protein
MQDLDYYYNMTLTETKGELTFTTLSLEDFSKKKDNNICPVCNVERIHHDSRVICPECGEVIDKFESFSVGYRKEKIPYKRITYFKETIQKMQGKVYVDLPDELLPKLRQEVLKNYCVWNILTLKKVLKKLGYSEFFPDVVYIFTLLFPNKSIAKLSYDEEKFILSSFCKLQTIWNIIKPKKRKTMLNNPYIIMKLLQLLKLHKKINYFTFPKDVHKLLEYDMIWKCACNHLGWTFISSFE